MEGGLLTPSAFVTFCQEQGVRVSVEGSGDAARVTLRGRKPTDTVAARIAGYLREHKPELVALLTEPMPLPASIIELQDAASRGVLPRIVVTLCPGTTTSDPNRWVTLAVTRLRSLQAKFGADYLTHPHSDGAITEADLQTVADAVAAYLRHPQS